MSDTDYERLYDFRSRLIRFLRASDGRVVRLSLTAAGKQRLERVAAVNFRELGQLRLLTEGLDQANNEEATGPS